jgi:hypothetical protein
MLPFSNVEILEHIDEKGRSPYADWFDALDPVAAAKGAVALARMSQGNFSNANVLVVASMNTESTSVRAIEFISGGTVST